MNATAASRPSPVHFKLVVDTAAPHAQADFWAAALHYEVEDHSALIAGLLDAGAVTEEAVVEHHGRRAWRDAAAVRHPEDPYDPRCGVGTARRLLFNRVPEAAEKPGKNRLHIDLHGPDGQREAEVERLTALGARVQRHVAEPSGSWVIMTDPEGNEFCVH
ncbi:VOC family protein [Streptomyces sp. NPDC058045]|uniref:VOC family protein n=1 Tax=Streptomyces sp. NPDC058045 TaxID=3346311 RepID=UPI0036EFADC3